ncbi:acyltransferase, partial [Bacillus cereus]
MVWCFLFLYPALTGSKTPHQNSAEAKKLGG